MSTVTANPTVYTHPSTPRVYCQPGERVDNAAAVRFGAGCRVDVMERGPMGQRLIGFVAARRSGPHFAVYA
jgi:hypothetical protein